MIAGGLVALGGAVGLVLAIAGAIQPFSETFVSYFTFAAVLLVGLGLALIGLAMSFEEPSARNAPLFAGIVCLIFSFPGFLMAYAGYSKDAEIYRSQFRAVCVPAQVTSSRLYESGKTGSRKYYYRLQYTFMVNGRKHEDSDKLYEYKNEKNYKVCYQPKNISNHKIMEDTAAGAK